MPFKIVSVPARMPDDQIEELNAFLRGHRVLSVERQFFCNSSGPGWSFCVEYLETKKPGAPSGFSEKRIDYKEVLNDLEFPVFVRLRALRKAIAAREALPVYAIFTNEQLAQMIRSRAKTRSELGQIEGIGESRLVKFADEFLTVLHEVFP